MGKFKRFILNLQFIFKPRYWIMSHEYNSEWDKKLNYLLDNHIFHSSTDDGFTAKLGDKTLWVANYPYDCFIPYNAYSLRYRKSQMRASRLTILKAHKKYIKEISCYDTD